MKPKKLSKKARRRYQTKLDLFSKKKKQHDLLEELLKDLDLGD